MRKIFPGYLEDLDTNKVHVSETNMQTHCLIWQRPRHHPRLELGTLLWTDKWPWNTQCPDGEMERVTESFTGSGVCPESEDQDQLAGWRWRNEGREIVVRGRGARTGPGSGPSENSGWNQTAEVNARWMPLIFSPRAGASRWRISGTQSDPHLKLSFWLPWRKWIGGRRHWENWEQLKR